MLQNLTWSRTDSLARNQLQVFSQLGEQMALRPDDQRRVLLLSEEEWANWSGFVLYGPLPARPQLPVMLRRLGRASHQLAVLADRRAIASR